MENENKKNGWKMFFYLTPLYILLAYPLYHWHKEINSSDIDLSKNDYSAFSSDKGEIKQTSFSKSHIPQFQDSGYAVNYKLESKGDYEKNSRLSRKKYRTNNNQKRQSNIKANLSVKDKEHQYIGRKKGYLTSAVGAALKNPKVVKTLFNNSLVIKGFMGRDRVKKVLKDSDALTDYIMNTDAADNFLNNSIVKKALNNPSIVEAVISSKLASKILSSPAVKGLLKDSEKTNKLLSSNPEFMILLANPLIMNALMQNPETASALSNINLR